MRCSALIIGGVLLLALPAQAAHRSDFETQTIRVVSNRLSTRLVLDRPPKGSVNKGDTLSATSRLNNAVNQFGRPKGAVVGTDVWVTTVISFTANTLRARIRATVTLPGGTIRLAGTAVETKLDVPVVGGTGAFAGARGTTDVSIRTDDVALVTYRLRLP